MNLYHDMLITTVDDRCGEKREYMGFFEQLLGKSEFKTCEMNICFVQDEDDSGYIIAEIYGEGIIGWNKYIHTLCAFKEMSDLYGDEFIFESMIKKANLKQDITIPVRFHIKGGSVIDLRIDFVTYSRRIDDERFAELEMRGHHVLNVKKIKK